MPHEITWEKHGVYRRLYGTVTIEELEEVDEEFYADPRAIRIRYQIIDARDVVEMEAAEAGIRERAAYDLGFSQSAKNHRVALVSESPAVLQAFEFYAALLRENHCSWTLASFPTLKAAKDWTGD